MFGKGNDKSGVDPLAIQGEAAKRYAAMASSAGMASGAPDKQSTDYYSAIAAGGPAASTAAAPQIAFYKRQLANSRQQVRDYMPRGGAQSRANRQLTAAAPGQITSIYSKQIQDAMAKLQEIARQKESTSMTANSGAATVGSALAEQARLKAASSGNAWASLAGPLGYFFGSRTGAPTSTSTTGRTPPYVAPDPRVWQGP